MKVTKNVRKKQCFYVFMVERERESEELSLISYSGLMSDLGADLVRSK